MYRYSPCMWGWSSSCERHWRFSGVFPMYVGVILSCNISACCGSSIPHVCGGDPIRPNFSPKMALYSPCMWGWSSAVIVSWVSPHVFPMYVGVILGNNFHHVATMGIPHVCGGDPKTAMFVSTDALVFPMYVGVILGFFAVTYILTGIPHVCGGDPHHVAAQKGCESYSPCMWGWSYQIWFSWLSPSVFPMYVGVILGRPANQTWRDSIPHVCGGDPGHAGSAWTCGKWWNAWHVFPMYVGVIPLFQKANQKRPGIPHVCGGDPVWDPKYKFKVSYSPCMWGWSSLSAICQSLMSVFPMYVGVILPGIALDPHIDSIPHVCGGDPKQKFGSEMKAKYSPCMWGWSLLKTNVQIGFCVFPMYVGVILSRNSAVRWKLSIPHVCGGDPWKSRNKGGFPTYSPCMWGWSFN